MAKNEEPVDQSTLAWRIWKARTDAGLTQDQLAKRAGLKSQSIIGMLESGQRRRTTYIVQIADALMVDPAWLTEGRGPKRPEGGAVGAVGAAVLASVAPPLPAALSELVNAARALNEKDVRLLAQIALRMAPSRTPPALPPMESGDFLPPVPHLKKDKA